MDAAKNGAGKPLDMKLDDPKYKGMDKIRYTTESQNGNKSTVHYIKNKETGETYQFKFKRSSDGTVY